MLIRDSRGGCWDYTLPDNLDCPTCGVKLRKNHRGFLGNVFNGLQYCSPCAEPFKQPAREKHRLIQAERAIATVSSDIEAYSKQYPEFKAWFEATYPRR